ncbi:response regulator [Domibacillus aminovorans]|uniref:Response regulatory domain-containing protein n=1 Tax=Domibacillus aminovorans TaxID=29332 RepID=A0A177L3P2_9BACI|nr:response regulator [Domibacillus aminovorans]OAH60309.1 hypothetical protein AWH49_16980 [Domibacillus aminovorans]
MLQAILVDDESLSLQLLKKKLANVGGVEVIGAFSNVESVLQEIKNLDFQVAFLDIEMAGISGLELAEIILDRNSNIHIVFITAYRDYAIQAFELDSLDYLLKPVMESRLEKTIARLKMQVEKEIKEQQLQEKSAPSSIKVICFNEFRVYAGDELVKWKTAKAKELFAFFIMHLHTYVNRDTIIDLLWPDYDYKKAKIQLHTNLSYLRKSLESMGYKQALTFSNQSYSLTMDYFYCDAMEMERIIDDHSKIDEDNIAEMEKIIPLYIGDYMEKNSFEWAYSKAQVLKDKWLQQLQKMTDYYTESNEYDKKRQCLHMILKYNPYSEHVLQQLMIHYIEEGNRVDAIQLYQDFVALLYQDLGIEPGIATKRLYESIQNAGGILT